MGIEFMVGATLLSSIKLVIFLFVLWLAYRVVKKVYMFNTDINNEKELNVKWELFGFGIVTLFFFFFASAAQPKLVIEVPQDRELIEYQRNQDDIVIETPPPRTENLNGFQPLRD